MHWILEGNFAILVCFVLYCIYMKLVIFLRWLGYASVFTLFCVLYMSNKADLVLLIMTILNGL